MQIEGFSKFQVYQFQPQRKKNKKRQLNQETFGCFIQDQPKNRQIVLEKLLLLMDS